jgi:hypothetical protein
MVRLEAIDSPGGATWPPTPGACGLLPIWRSNIHSSAATSTREWRMIVGSTGQHHRRSRRAQGTKRRQRHNPFRLRPCAKPSACDTAAARKTELQRSLGEHRPNRRRAGGEVAGCPRGRGCGGGDVGEEDGVRRGWQCRRRARRRSGRHVRRVGRQAVHRVADGSSDRSGPRHRRRSTDRFAA